MKDHHLTSESLKARELVTVQDAAKTAGVDQRTLLKRLHEHKIPIIRLGRRNRSIMLASFDKLLTSLVEHRAA